MNEGPAGAAGAGDSEGTGVVVGVGVGVGLGCVVAGGVVDTEGGGVRLGGTINVEGADDVAASLEQPENRVSTAAAKTGSDALNFCDLATVPPGFRTSSSRPKHRFADGVT